MLSHFNHVQLFATPWTVAHQVPLSMGFSRQGFWSGLPCLPPGDLPNPGIKFLSLMCPELAGGFFNTSVTLEAPYSLHSVNYSASIQCMCVCVLGGIFNVYSNPLSRRYFFPCFNDKVTGDKMLTLTEVGINIHCNLHCTTFVDYYLSI